LADLNNDDHLDIICGNCVRPFLIPHLHDWRKMEVCLINSTTGDWWELFRIVQYLVMEYNCVRKITEGLFRKYSTL
jgi:hypothetical protein